MALKTTTWKDRNIDNLERTRDKALDLGIVNPSVVNFGPGGSVSFLADALPSGRTSDLSRSKRFFRRFESFIRKTGLFKLVTNEPVEILRVFKPLSPAELHVIDKQRKVLSAVGNLVKDGIIKIPVTTGKADLLKKPVDIAGDIVVALNIIARTGDRELALKHIAKSVRPGGLLCINIDDPPDGFTKVGHCLYQRNED